MTAIGAGVPIVCVEIFNQERRYDFEDAVYFLTNLEEELEKRSPVTAAPLDAKLKPATVAPR